MSQVDWQTLWSATLDKRTVLVTGATGFIGQALVRRLVPLAGEVRVLALADDPLVSRPGVLSPDVRLCAGDLRREETLSPALQGVEILFHCAGMVSDWAPRRLYREVNVLGTNNLLAAASQAGVFRFVHISTNDVFGRGEGRIIDETFPLSRWGEPYPDTKIAAERACWRYHGEGRLDVSMVYPCWVYGPGDRRFVPEIAQALVRRKMVLWRRDCLVWPNYVENLVDLLLLVATREEARGQGYLAHDGMSLTLEEFCRVIARAIEAPPPRLVLPKLVAYGAALVMQTLWRLLRLPGRPLLTTYIVKNFGARLQFSIEKARRELGFVPRVGFEDGFDATLEWMRGEGMV